MNGVQEGMELRKTRERITNKVSETEESEAGRELKRRVWGKKGGRNFTAIRILNLVQKAR